MNLAEAVIHKARIEIAITYPTYRQLVHKKLPDGSIPPEMLLCIDLMDFYKVYPVLYLSFLCQEGPKKEDRWGEYRQVTEEESARDDLINHLMALGAKNKNDGMATAAIAIAQMILTNKYEGINRVINRLEYLVDRLVDQRQAIALARLLQAIPVEQLPGWRAVISDPRRRVKVMRDKLDVDSGVTRVERQNLDAAEKAEMMRRLTAHLAAK